jgi:hypothetical protein
MVVEILESATEFAEILNNSAYDKSDPTYVERHRRFKESLKDQYEKKEIDIPEEILEEEVEGHKEVLERGWKGTYNFTNKAIDVELEIDMDEVLA